MITTNALTKSVAPDNTMGARQWNKAEENKVHLLIEGDARIAFNRFNKEKVSVILHTMSSDRSKSVDRRVAFLEFVKCCMIHNIPLKETPHPDGLFYMTDGLPALLDGKAHALPSEINIANGITPGEVIFYGKGTEEECTNFLGMMESFVFYLIESGLFERALNESS